MDPEARKIHGQAEQAREQGDFIKALHLTDEAMVIYQQSNDKLGFAEIQASRFLTLRHLFEQTGERNYLILAKHAAMASVEIAQESGEKEALAIPLFNLAKAQETLEELPQACQSYKQAVENMLQNPPALHNRPAVVADMQVHQYTCEYKAGDKSALARAAQALQNLEEAEEVSDYEKHVWVSGGHMKIAEMLKEDNIEKAKEHLRKAKEIIDADNRLELRKKQWKKLAQTFS